MRRWKSADKRLGRSTRSGSTSKTLALKSTDFGATTFGSGRCSSTSTAIQIRGCEQYPFVVDVQSDVLQDLATRMVVPLATTGLIGGDLPQRLSPSFVVRNQTLMLVAFEAAAINKRVLKTSVASIKDRAHEVIAAMDAVLSGF
ncbi:MAG: CcdB family protein [Burkholderiales bacterium]